MKDSFDLSLIEIKKINGNKKNLGIRKGEI